MSKLNNSHVPLPSPREMLRGTHAFLDILRRNPKIRKGMASEILRTWRNRESHTDLNKNQYPLLHEYAERNEKPRHIAVLVPGFQLDGTSLLGFQNAFNKQGIPAFFPSKLPHGFNAVKFSQHPDILVELIVNYVREIQRAYPETEILLVGHSYGGPQILHAADTLQLTGKVTPITMAGVLDAVGPMAQAGHAILYRIPSYVFSGKDGFIDKAREIQSNQNSITVVDSHDGYLPLHVQAGVHANNLENNPRVIVSRIESPGHYKGGIDAHFSGYITGLVINKLKEQEQTQTIPQ